LRTRSRFDLLALGTAMMILVTLVAVVAIVGGVFAPGLRELHATWWFRALLAWSCIALAVCGLRELVELCASLCGRGFRWRRPSGTVLVRELRGPTAERMHSRLREFGYRVSRWDAGGDRIVEGVKGWIGWAGNTAGGRRPGVPREVRHVCGCRGATVRCSGRGSGSGALGRGSPLGAERWYAPPSGSHATGGQRRRAPTDESRPRRKGPWWRGASSLDRTVRHAFQIG
jgi:hypothetical protein